jgi:hypothetical protein
MKKRIVGISIVAAFACGCASNPTRSSGVVALEIPDPPPKPDILPAPAPEAPPERPAPPVAAERPPTSAPVARPTTPPPAQPAAAPSASTPAASASVNATESTPSSPAPELRPAGSAARALTGAQVRESLARTKQKLDGIDRRRLNAGKRADYDSARRFLAQADTAINGNNLMLAQSSVEKAETLANGLR